MGIDPKIDVEVWAKHVRRPNVLDQVGKNICKGWDMQADPTFSAQKDITQHYVSPAGDFKEKTTLKLKPYTE